MPFTHEDMVKMPMEQRLNSILLALQSITFQLPEPLFEFVIDDVTLKGQGGAMIADIVAAKDNELLVHWRARSEGSTITLPKSSVDNRELIKYLEKFLVLVTYAVNQVVFPKTVEFFAPNTPSPSQE